MNRLHRTLLVFVIASGLVAGACARRQQAAPPATTPAGTPPATTTTPPAPPTGTSTSEAPGPVTAAEVAARLQPVFFDYDSATLDEPARSRLDANARILRENPDATLVIEGHCDERGTAEYNQALGERRAMAVRDYLTAAGIDGSRLRVISYGKERPFATGSDESSWAQNRRAHFSAA